MAALMVSLALIALVVGPTLLTGQPLLVALGVVLAATVLLVARRARRVSSL
ncbi:hypothetical protein GCM10010168_88270 [Actinoplanes ianthinogenes]|uniref:Uncharacterized protein n=1 Tax=Actinoplanes ianthinogenes TaxID=122358 RepID=A0ABM7LRN3_9ACTN|nr:hypothetical protein [Actinoplanes ianthinogenes]BCJ41931.1 hypothetical protein Aiant_25880 [Actinoplanes ianthinogenes]GGR55692.1 hypothetical protein GCM10010168_88270 [Actinoplanes ianthinogenes]